jgi:hypothetical protein
MPLRMSFYSQNKQRPFLDWNYRFLFVMEMKGILFMYELYIQILIRLAKASKG